MKRYAPVLVAFFMIAGLAVRSEAKDRPALLAPEFKLRDLYYDEISLSSFREDKQPVLLFFWTTWCPFCQRELNVLKDMYGTLAKDGVEVLAIDVGEMPDKVDALVKSYNLSFRVLLDKDSGVANSYGVMGVPTYVLVNQDGFIAFQDNDFPAEYKDLVSISK